ncbi:unnamed protein product [Zymoseptoria tritici ST99CH_3D7]|uniref:BTB domain-containing protein n=1 Tax=Zymoseptoria tritici (strain ST99CH_3D7) TaxID=1276538 RepID=A0A1X7RMP9_ZYMT9|nr:unnamed protein product [Zymoseptoria tritici ST99CH_3D7]
MSKEIGPLLRLATEELLDSSLFSDLTIICGDTYHQVHKVVLFAHGGKFREVAESAHAAITLNDKNPLVLDAVVQYLYRLEFTTPQGYELDEFMFAANVYFMAMEYGVRGLPQLALEKFAEACDPEEDLGLFVRAIRFAERMIANHDDEFWRALSRVAEAQFDFLEEQRESGGLSDHDQKSLDNLLGNIRAGDHPGSHEGSSDGGHDGDDGIGGGGAAEDDMSPAVDDQTPIFEPPIPEQRSYVPPHRRHQQLGPVAVEQNEGDLQKKQSPGQLNAAASAFVPSFAAPAHEAEANQKSEETTYQEEPAQTDDPTPSPAATDQDDWKDLSNDNYDLTNSSNDNGGYSATEGSSQPRAPESNFESPGYALDEPILDPVAHAEQQRAVRDGFLARMESKKKATQPSMKWETKYRPRE